MTLDDSETQAKTVLVRENRVTRENLRYLQTNELKGQTDII
jgi:hypothetical protein